MKRIRRSGSGPPKIEGRGPGAIHPYEALAAAWFLLYLTVPLRSGDDGWFHTVFHNYFAGELIPFLDYRYHTWSTRLILEALTLPLIDVPLLYRLSVPLWGVAAAGAVRRISGGLSRRGQWMLCLGLLLLSPMPFSRAGYVCSSVNYLFTLACLLWAAEPVIALLRGEKVPLWRQLLALPLTVLACNMEYYCPPALIAALAGTVWAVKRRKNPALPLALVVVVLLSGLFAANAPTSTVAAYAQAEDLFPGYEALGVGEKLLAGFVSTAGGMLSTYCGGAGLLLPVLTLGALLALWGWEREGRWLRWMYLLPLLIPIATGGIARLCPAGSLWPTLFYDSQSGFLWDHPAAFCAALGYFAALLACLWRWRRGVALWAALALFCLVLMGFSRSVFDSGLRTFTPLALLICVTCALLAGELRHKRAAWAILGCGAGAVVLQFIVFQLSGGAG